MKKLKYIIKMIDGEIITFENESATRIVIISDIFKKKIYMVDSKLVINTDHIVYINIEGGE